MAFKLILCLALLAFAVDEPEVPTDASDISPEILEQVESAAD